MSLNSLLQIPLIFTFVIPVVHIFVITSERKSDHLQEMHEVCEHVRVCTQPQRLHWMCTMTRSAASGQSANSREFDRPITQFTHTQSNGFLSTPRKKKEKKLLLKLCEICLGLLVIFTLSPSDWKSNTGIIGRNKRIIKREHPKLWLPRATVKCES